MAISNASKSSLKNGILKSRSLGYLKDTTEVTSGLVLELDASDPASYSGSGSTWNDVSGQNNHATLVNSPTYAKGPYGYLAFNGVDQYATITPNSNLRVSDTFTFSTWIKWTPVNSSGYLSADAGPERETLFGNRVNNTAGCYQFELGNGNDEPYGIQATIPGTWIVSTQRNTMPIGKWVNVVWVRTANSAAFAMDVYLNGVKVPAKFGQVGTVSSLSDTIHIGNSGPLGNQWFTGQVSYMAMYNVALTRAQIAQNYNALKSRFIEEASSYAIPAECLLVGGGGGGGYAGPGGGGAGGYVTKLTDLNIGTSYTVTVGTGGACSGSTSAAGATGGNSVLGAFTAYGGGGGGSGDGVAAPTAGGSGGGASYNAGGASPYYGQGNFGGPSYSTQIGGGGGGAGSRGNSNGDGGFGLESSITGTATVYASGGGGYPSGSAFPGGGAGYQSNSNGTDGLGGGGGGNNGTSYRGGNGVVIIAYPISYPAITTIPGTLTYTVDTSTRSGYRVYKFTAGTGSVTI
jgi:hypothetical protein